MDDLLAMVGAGFLLLCVMAAIYFPTILRMIGGVCQ